MKDKVRTMYKFKEDHLYDGSIILYTSIKTLREDCGKVSREQIQKVEVRDVE